MLVVCGLWVSLINYRNATRSGFNAMVVKGNVASLKQSTNPVL